MITKIDENGETCYLPESEDIDNLSVGDLCPSDGSSINPRKITEITHRGVDVLGKKFALFYREFSDHATMSGSIKEGEPIMPYCTQADIYKMAWRTFGLIFKRTTYQTEWGNSCAWTWEKDAKTF